METRLAVLHDERTKLLGPKAGDETNETNAWVLNLKVVSGSCKAFTVFTPAMLDNLLS